MLLLLLLMMFFFLHPFRILFLLYLFFYWKCGTKEEKKYDRLKWNVCAKRFVWFKCYSSWWSGRFFPRFFFCCLSLPLTRHISSYTHADMMTLHLFIYSFIQFIFYHFILHFFLQCMINKRADMTFSTATQQKESTTKIILAKNTSTSSEFNAKIFNKMINTLYSLQQWKV